MSRILGSALLAGAFVVLATTLYCSCTHRGSSLEGPVAEAWVARYSSQDGAKVSDQAHDIAVDASGNVYVTGQGSTRDTSRDYLTVKYDDGGRQMWSAQYNGPSSSIDSANAIAVDTSGNVYVTGGSTVEGQFELGPYDYDYVTIKYDADGTQLWVARYNGSGNFHDEANDIALDKSGNVYVTGTSSRAGYGAESRLQEYATIKYDGNGNELWVARYHGPVQGPDCANAIAVDVDGNVFVTGYSVGGQYERYGSVYTIFDYATIKYDTDGDELWVARYGSPGGGHSLASALALDSRDNVYVTGESQSYDVESDHDYVTVKYDGAGQELWVARYDGPASKWDKAEDIAIDAWGNVCVTGSVTCGSRGGDPEYATVKYDTDGNQLWVTRYGSAPTDGGDTGMDNAYAIAVDGSGNVYVTGQSYHSGEDQNIDADSVTIKYDADGHQIWVARHNGPGSGMDLATAIALDSAGNVYVAGFCNSGSRIDCLTIKYIPK